MRRWCIGWSLLLASCGRLSFDAGAFDAGANGARDGAVDAAPLGPWSEPQSITALSSPDDDSDPELRGDGLELIFHSDRPGTGGLDLYHSVRATTADD